MFKKNCLSFLFLSFSFSTIALAETQVTQGQAVIVDDLNWQEIIDIDLKSSERQNSYAVGELIIPVTRESCTAFFISSDVILTNNHCVENEAQAVGVRLVMMKEKGVAEEKWWRLDCSEFVGTDFTLDVTLLRCQGNPGEIFGALVLDGQTLMKPGAPLYVLQQNCDFLTNSTCLGLKKIARGSMLTSGIELAHNADTLGGSSGAPLFSALTHQVVGIHHAGLPDLGPGHGTANYAIRTPGVVRYLESNFPQVVLGRILPKVELFFRE